LKRLLILSIVVCVLLGMIAWGALTITYSNLASASLRAVLSWTFTLGSLAVLLFLRPRRRAVVVFVTVFAGVLLWWLGIPPSHDRDWQPDVAVLPSADINGDRITIHNIRHNDYRSDTDYTVRYDEKTFALSQLQTMDIFISFWGSPYIAHTIMSFGFGGDDYVAISIETRKSKDEEYSAIKGFFKQYELIYVVSDERDVVRLRTNYRGEDVYLYRFNVRPELIRSVFLDYFTYINHLKEQPAWYNALTHNCTTSIRGHVIPHTVNQRWPHWKLLVNGYLDERLYEIAAVDRSLPFADLKARSLISDRAKAVEDVANFSREIRAGLPGLGQEGSRGLE
jgi:Domain of unknown function (DUF4105)